MFCLATTFRPYISSMVSGSLFMGLNSAEHGVAWILLSIFISSWCGMDSVEHLVDPAGSADWLGMDSSEHLGDRAGSADWFGMDSVEHIVDRRSGSADWLTS